MELHKYLIVACILVAIPSFAYATGTVRINEVAWMGTKTSSNAEWIELFNNSNAKIQLNGWKLTSSDGSPHINFSDKDTISPKGYFLLERTHPNAIPGVKADKIYKGSLKNTGETLTLTNMASTTEDTIVGGKNWCAIGGDNSTKQTAQYTKNGWVTATGTPRAINTTIGISASCTSTKSTTTTASTTNGTASTTPTKNTTISGHYGTPEFEPVPVVLVSIGNDMNIVAGADVRFSAIVINKKGKQYISAIVHWAFGDGSKATGTNVLKNYRVPGTYAVVANAIQGLGSGEDDMIVTVRDAHVSIPSVSALGVTIRNDTPYRLDMSLWRLRADTTTFIFPQHTTILPNTSVLFPTDITKLPITSDTVLLYPNNKEIVRYIPRNSIGQKRVLSVEKLSSTSARYSTVQGGEDKNTYPLVQQNIIHSHNATKAYDTKASIAPASATYIVDAGAPVATAFVAPLTTTTSFTYRFLSYIWTPTLLFALITSAILFIFL